MTSAGGAVEIAGRKGLAKPVEMPSVQLDDQVDVMRESRFAVKDTGNRTGHHVRNVEVRQRPGKDQEQISFGHEEKSPGRVRRPGRPASPGAADEPPPP